jgi:hypothetical protein
MKHLSLLSTLHAASLLWHRVTNIREVTYRRYVFLRCSAQAGSVQRWQKLFIGSHNEKEENRIEEERYGN